MSNTYTLEIESRDGEPIDIDRLRDILDGPLDGGAHHDVYVYRVKRGDKLVEYTVDSHVKGQGVLTLRGRIIMTNCATVEEAEALMWAVWREPTND